MVACGGKWLIISWCNILSDVFNDDCYLEILMLLEVLLVQFNLKC